MYVLISDTITLRSIPVRAFKFRKSVLKTAGACSDLRYSIACNPAHLV